MINQLYTFTVGTYVVADEWNANFKAVSTSNTECKQAIEDANTDIAFKDGDLSGVFDAVRAKPNSRSISGDTQLLSAGTEYYKTLLDGETLTLVVPENMNGESRVIIKIQDDRDLTPVVIGESYNGEVFITGLDRVKFKSGIYYLFILEQNGVLMVKTIKKGTEYAHI